MKNEYILKHRNPFKNKKRGKKMGFLDALAKAGLILVVVYLIAKALGVIHSPVALDVGAIISGSYFVWRYATKIDKINNDIEDLRDICPNTQKLTYYWKIPNWINGVME